MDFNVPHLIQGGGHFCVPGMPGSLRVRSTVTTNTMLLVPVQPDGGEGHSDSARAVTVMCCLKEAAP